MQEINLILKSTKQYVKDFFTKGHPRSIAAKKNIAASLVIRGITITINLALVPLLINYVNTTQYGIWLTLSSIIAWFGFFDIGFGNGLRNRFAEANATKDFNKARIYISTTYAVLTIIFMTVWLIFFIINFLVDWSAILNAPPQMAIELSILAIIVFSFLSLSIVLKTITTIIVADQKPALASFINMLGQLLSLIIILILRLTTRGTLINLGLALGIAPIIVLTITSLIFFTHKYKQFAPSFNTINFLFARDIITLGIKFFIIQIGALVIFQTTNIVIAQVLGPENVTVYNIAFKYFSALSMVFFVILSPFWSAFTEAYTRQDYSWMKSVIKKLKFFWILSIPIAFTMLLLANYIYKLWIGNVIIIPISVSISIFVLVLTNMRFNLFINLINGIGKVKLQLYLNVAISIVYIPLAVYATEWFGLTGIIWANIFVSLIIAIISQIQMSKLMINSTTGIWYK